jgi:hypothetical protein
MEVRSKQSPRMLRRCYQRCHCEAQILALAYEQVYPQARRVLLVRNADAKATVDKCRSAARRA